MSINKYRPHIFVIPEDDANRQLINGFLLHDAVADRAVDVRAPAGGWSKVLLVFEEEYVPLLYGSPHTHVMMLVDFDGIEDRRNAFDKKIPDELRTRVFVLGSKDEPETLKREFGMSFERIGVSLAQECVEGEFRLWRHAHLIDNEAELRRMIDVVKPILFL
jgi:hypothetical protein